MKSIPSIFIIVLSAWVLVSSCQQKKQESAPTTTPTSKEADIQFEKEAHDFGQLESGERVAYAFSFTNTGGEPLLITNTRSGCGCTVGDYPREPIMPGESGKIRVIFNSAGKRGFQSETVRVFTNTPQEMVTIRITAEVIQQ